LVEVPQGQWEVVGDEVGVDFDSDKAEVELVDHPVQGLREGWQWGVFHGWDWEEGWSETGFKVVVLVYEGEVGELEDSEQFLWDWEVLVSNPDVEVWHSQVEALLN